MSRTNGEVCEVRRREENRSARHYQFDLRLNITYPQDFLCPEISFLHERRGMTFVSVLYRLLRPQFPPTNFLNEQFTSMLADQDNAEDCVKIVALL